MNHKKLAISLFLMFAYAIGFTHNVIPHCHHQAADNQHEHTEHHQHLSAGDDHNNEGHVAHNEHLDEGVMDFIICLLSETEHPSPSGDESFYFSAEETPRTSSLNINVLPSLAIEASMIHAVSQIEKTIHVNLIEGLPCQGLRYCLPDRAPPSIAV